MSVVLRPGPKSIDASPSKLGHEAVTVHEPCCVVPAWVGSPVRGPNRSALAGSSGATPTASEPGHTYGDSHDRSGRSCRMGLAALARRGASTVRCGRSCGAGRRVLARPAFVNGTIRSELAHLERISVTELKTLISGRSPSQLEDLAADRAVRLDLDIEWLRWALGLSEAKSFDSQARAPGVAARLTKLVGVLASAARPPRFASGVRGSRSVSLRGLRGSARGRSGRRHRRRSFRAVATLGAGTLG
jgi:hypothetical protein